MKKEEIRDALPGDLFSIDMGDIRIVDAQILKTVDYDKDGLPDNVYVFGYKEGTASIVINVFKPEKLTFTGHDPKVKALLDEAQGGTNKTEFNKLKIRNEQLNEALKDIQKQISKLV